MGTLSSIGSSLVSAAQFALPAKEARDSSVEINLKNKQLEQNAAYQKQKNLLALNTSETERQSKLRKALSTQRANFGSQGIGSATGSAEAVLQGTFADSDIERQQKQAATERDNAAIDANLASQKQLNLLQKQQLQQKATLGYLTDLF